MPNLTLPSQVKLHPCIINSTRFLIDRYRSDKFPNFERIYISRGKANRRTIANEAACQKLLKDYGFHEVFMEDIGFAEKINIMQAAKVVITVDSSSVTNVIFSKPGTKLLIFTFKCMPLYNLFISSTYEIDTCYQICEPDDPNNYSWYESNIIVDLAKLEDKLVNWALKPRA